VAHGLLRRAIAFAAITLQLAKSRAYIGCDQVMRLSLAVCCALIGTAFATPTYADVRSDAKAQVDFGINVAQRGLWREAIYRWEKAVQIDPTYAAALNDLAVAYEHEGQLAKAREAYEKALAIDPNNAQIKQNYDLFKEINDRTSVKKETP